MNDGPAWNGWRFASPYERWSVQIADPTQRGDTADPDLGRCKRY
jgi:hypothetical protein